MGKINFLIIRLKLSSLIIEREQIVQNAIVCSQPYIVIQKKYQNVILCSSPINFGYGVKQGRIHGTRCA